MADPPRTPSISGTLATRSLAELLVQARTKRLTGRFMFRAPDGRGGIIDLWRAQIVRVRTNPPVSYFGAVALDLRLAEAAVLESARTEAMEKKRLHGEVLVERKVLTAAQRDAVLAEQACRKIETIFAMPREAQFTFHDEKPSVAEPPFTLDPVAPVWRVLRDSPPTEALRAAIVPLGTKALKIVNEAPIARVPFSPEEKKLCELLVDRPMTLKQMCSALPGVPEARLERLAYLLVLTGCVDLVRASTAAMPAVSVFASRAMSEDAVVAALNARKRPPPRGDQ